MLLDRCVYGRLKFSLPVMLLMVALFVVACGDDNGTSENGGASNEVKTIDDIGRCVDEREGDTVYVIEKMRDYVCVNHAWIDASVPLVLSSSSEEKEPVAESSSSEKLSSSSAEKKASSSSKKVSSSSEQAVSSSEKALSSSSVAEPVSSSEKVPSSSSVEQSSSSEEPVSSSSGNDVVSSSSEQTVSSSETIPSSSSAEESISSCSAELESSSSEEPPYRDVDDVSEIGECNASRELQLVFNKGNRTMYLCSDNVWTVYEPNESSSSKEVSSSSGETEVSSSSQEPLPVCFEGDYRWYDKDKWAICKSNAWLSATVFEVDTYGWETGAEGEVKQGNAVPSNYYVFENGGWRVATAVEKDLGLCDDPREDEFGVSEGVPYICHSKKWELDKGLRKVGYYKENCPEGEICSYKPSWYIGLNEKWDIHEFRDVRDGQVYKTVTIGEQTWLGQNLNYEYNKGSALSACEAGEEEYSCNRYGRYYMWSAAIDSVRIYADSSKRCGFQSACELNRIQGVCPAGWHLPSSAEWLTLFKATGDSYTAASKLKGKTSGALWVAGAKSWTDEYGFSALPAGNYSQFLHGPEAWGNRARFWTSDNVSTTADHVLFSEGSDTPSIGGLTYKNYGLNVRCVLD